MRARRRVWIRRSLRALVVVALVAVGVALGEALHDNPKTGGTRTVNRVLKPVPLAPAVETVTVTVTTGSP
jgi:hypothetical protein